tara:strand:+ start:2025 stop:3056 length:1032 start_codon:yes stop_codon:yes gene_type:complete
MRPLRLGIIGAGNFVVKRHIPEILEIKDKIELACICRRDEKILKDIGKLFGIKSLYRNHLEMLKSEKLDLVLIASPHSLHYRHAIDALNFNCHVIIEKPMATSLEESKKMVIFAKKKKKKIIALYNPPFEGHIKTLKKIISDKKIFGKVEHVNLTWLDYKSPFFGKGQFLKSQLSKIMPSNFRKNNKLSAGGILFDSGCHLIAEIVWILKDKPNSIYANFDKLNKELRLSLSIEYKNLFFININIIGNSQFNSRRVESCYFGSKCTVKLTGKPYEISIIKKNSKKTNLIKNFLKVKTPILEAVDNIIRNKKLEISLDQSLSITSIIEHAYKSSKSGKKEKIKY